MPTATDLSTAFDGEVLHPSSPGYDEVRRPVAAAFHDVRPALVVRCGSVRDVVRALQFARETGSRVAIRGGGHCFAGRSSTDGILLDLTLLDDISVTGDGVATIGAGARLAKVYTALHEHGRTVPAGCGPTVGIAGLTLGGGIGLLGRAHSLTCDRLLGAQVVLADGTVVECDATRDPELFWALRGAGGCQFGVVTELRFDTIAEPIMTRIDGQWHATAELIAAWQAWAPDEPDDLTANLTIVAEPGSPARAVLSGASTLSPAATAASVRRFTAAAGVANVVTVRGGIPYHRLKESLSDPREQRSSRIRSEFFAGQIEPERIAGLLTGLAGSTFARQLTFTAMGGAYNRVEPEATAFAHRGERFVLEHIGDADDPWVDDSWATAHPDGSGRVYPNFPDPALDDAVSAYHGENHRRLRAIKRTYDPDRLFDGAQAIKPAMNGAT